MVGMSDALPLAMSMIGIGVLVGVMSAMFGVGGGVIMVPFLVFAADVSQHMAEGTSLLVIVPTAIAGVVAHRKRGYVLPKPAALIAFLGAPAAAGGALLALSLDPSQLQNVFGLFVIVVGLRLVFQGWRGRDDDGTEPPVV